MTGTSDQLVSAFAEPLRRSGERRFMSDVAEGTLERAVWHNYLAAEGAFVRHVVRIYGWCLWQLDPLPPCTGAFLSSTVSSLVREQFPLLATNGRADPLVRHVEEARRAGGVAAVLACMLAAETLYENWCTRAVLVTASRTSAVQQWLELHAAPAFREGRLQLAAAVDELGGAGLEGWFAGMLTAEDEFHDSVYRKDSA